MIYFTPKQPNQLTTNAVHIVAPGVQCLKVTPYIWHMFATETMVIASIIVNVKIVILITSYRIPSMVPYETLE